MAKIFVTGVTGYIGGDAVHAIAHAHPEFEFTCLVRDSDKAASVAKEYASFKFAYGDLDRAELLEEEARKADIVLNFADANHSGSVAAILRGLAAHDPSRPGFLIHTSGTGVIMYEDVQASRFGAPSDTVYDDLDGLASVRAIPRTFLRRGVDESIFDAGKEYGDRVKTAIVCPPMIYGRGRGQGNRRSMQIPELVRCTLQKGHGVMVGEGKNVWSGVHVHDLSALYLKLVENAAAGESLAEWPGKPALWGEEGFFFCESREVIFAEVARMVAREAQKQGYLEGDEVRSIGPEEASKLTHRGDVLWGCNSRSRAKRAREALQWKSEGQSLEEVVKEQVEMEAKAQEMKIGHAKKAAGDA